MVHLLTVLLFQESFQACFQDRKQTVPFGGSGSREGVRVRRRRLISEREVRREKGGKGWRNGVGFEEMGLYADHEWNNPWRCSRLLYYAPYGAQLQGEDERETETIRD
ncbi:hypothetical protein LINGRAHAP2_LOCUS29521 [Linum grandiflorum]